MNVIADSRPIRSGVIVPKYGDVRDLAHRRFKNQGDQMRFRIVVFAQLSALQKLTGLLYFPITPTFPHLGLLGFVGYLPAKFKIRFLEPIDTVELGGAEAAEDKALVQTLAQEIRAQIQENLHEMLAKRKSVWLG